MRKIKPTTYVALGEQTGPRFCAAFSRGCGGDIVDDVVLRPGPVAMFGSPVLWELLNQARAEGRDWYYGDHGYFRRGTYYRIAKNRFQHTGSGWASSHRFKQLDIRIKPWRTRGTHILLCPPDQTFAGLNNFNAFLWERHIRRTLEYYTDRPIVTRRRNSWTGPLSEDLKNCWALVTYVSNAAVEAVIEGIPVFCTGACTSLLMGSSDIRMIENPVYHVDRAQWAANLAANQWTLAEIGSGECWDILQ